MDILIQSIWCVVSLFHIHFGTVIWKDLPNFENISKIQTHTMHWICHPVLSWTNSQAYQYRVTLAILCMHEHDCRHADMRCVSFPFPPKSLLIYLLEMAGAFAVIIMYKPNLLRSSLSFLLSRVCHNNMVVPGSCANINMMLYVYCISKIRAYTVYDIKK